MTIDFATITIVGTIVSLMTQGIKTLKSKFTFLNEYFTILVAVILSVLFATFFYFFQDSQFFATAGQILLIAGGIYTFLISRFEN